MCGQCGERRVNRPRGLCWCCYYTPGVLALHPLTSKYSVRGLGHSDSKSPLAKMPTGALPGSPAKIAVFRGRLERGESLFHPDDSDDDSGRYSRFLLPDGDHV